MAALASMTEIPDLPRRKLFYRIHEVGQMTGLKPHVLRYWETEFRELAPEKDNSDQRRYRTSDIEVVFAIKKLLYEDRFTIEGARKKVKEELRLLRAKSSEDNTPDEPEAAPRRAAVVETPQTRSIQRTAEIKTINEAHKPEPKPEPRMRPVIRIEAVQSELPFPSSGGMMSGEVARRLDDSLKRLRTEVNELLDMLK